LAQPGGPFAVPNPPPPLSVPETADLFRALADPTRLRLLLLLAERGKAFVGDLANALGTSQTTIRNHLGLLRRFGMVQSRREGLRVYYRLSSPFVAGRLRRVRED
jgi:ArsR family transcriptional regulator